MTSMSINKRFQVDRGLWWTSVIISLIGLLDSIYLTWIKLGSTTPLFCAPGGGCDVVNTSPYSELFGIPIAVLGSGAYFVYLLILLFETQKLVAKYTSLLIQFGIALIGVLYSAYLTYLELAVIHAICPYCVISAICLLILFVVSLIRLIKYEPIE